MREMLLGCNVRGRQHCNQVWPALCVGEEPQEFHGMLNEACHLNLTLITKAAPPVCLNKEKLNQINVQVRVRERNWNITRSRRLIFCMTEGSHFTILHMYFFSPLVMQLSTLLYKKKYD